MSEYKHNTCSRFSNFHSPTSWPPT